MLYVPGLAQLIGQLLRAGSALIGALLCCVVPQALADGQYSEDEVKAVFLYRFAGYIEWPTHAPSNGHFVIAVLGAQGVADKLEALLHEHPVKGRYAVLKRLASIHEIDVSTTQMLFVGKGHAHELGESAAEMAGRPVLVVTDDDQGLLSGGMVNFMVAGNRVQFEVSLPAAEASGLKIMSELLSVARRVQRGNEGSNASCFPGHYTFNSSDRCADVLFAQAL